MTSPNPQGAAPNTTHTQALRRCLAVRGTWNFLDGKHT